MDKGIFLIITKAAEEYWLVNKFFQKKSFHLRFFLRNITAQTELLGGFIMKIQTNIVRMWKTLIFYWWVTQFSGRNNGLCV